MKNYLNHLIEDMHKAAENLPIKPYYDIPPEADGIEYVIEWENAEPKPMQECFGVCVNRPEIISPSGGGLRGRNF